MRGEISELLVLRQFLTPNFSQLAMLIGLLLVAIYRPEQDLPPACFACRAYCWLFQSLPLRPQWPLSA